MNMNQMAKIKRLVGEWVRDEDSGIVAVLEDEDHAIGTYGCEFEEAVTMAVVAVVLAQATTNDYRDESAND